MGQKLDIIFSLLDSSITSETGSAQTSGCVVNGNTSRAAI